MSISIKGTGSCAISTIDGIGYTAPELVIKDFCKKTLLNVAREAKGIPFAHYTFCAGPGTYGVKLAKYIEDNSLGQVATLGQIINPLYGGDHMCQAWLWNPNRAGLIAWWEAFGKTVGEETT